jgi:hypothetical protein
MWESCELCLVNGMQFKAGPQVVIRFRVFNTIVAVQLGV